MTAVILAGATDALTRKLGFHMAWFGERVEADALLVGYRSGAISRRSDKTLLRPGHGLGGLVFSSDKVQRVDDYLASPAITHHYDEPIKAEALQRILGAPIWADGTFYGVLMAGSRDGGTFGDRGVALFERAAGELSDALLASILERRLTALQDAARETAAQLRALKMRADATFGCIRDREREVLDLVALGSSNREIARSLQLSEYTVKSYLRNVMRRVGARNRTEAVAYARGGGYI